MYNKIRTNKEGEGIATAKSPGGVAGGRRNWGR